jgi:hypothetical protein
MTGVRNRIETPMDWSWDYVAHNRGPGARRAATGEIHWGDDRAAAAAGDAAVQQTTRA